MLESVTAILTCKDDVFLIKRKNNLPAFPGYLSFPGGKIDKQDHEKTAAGNIFSQHPQVLITALIREVLEETSYNLEANINNIEEIIYLGEAIAPSFNPVRFNNHYFQIILREKPHSFELCDHEIEWGKWLSKTAAYALISTSKTMAVPPTRKVLELFGKNIKFETPLDFRLPYDPESQVPWIEVIGGVTQFMPLSCTLPPANRTNCFLIGDILIDPSPRDLEEFEKIKNSLATFQYESILITHHHPDHHQFAPELAREKKLPIFLSQKTEELIKNRINEDYFNGIELNFIEDGDLIGNYQGHPLKVLAVPGHDAGQIALAPIDYSWVLVGDLIQGIGTVVISEPEGDMQEYFLSLEKVISLNPAAILPSHGIPLGGTFKLKQTLEHRKAREQQILELHQQGHDIEKVVDEIYKGLDPGLRRYAVKTVHAHLKKLKNEGKISQDVK